MASKSSTSPAGRSPPLSYHLLQALGLKLVTHIPILRSYFALNSENPKQIMRTSVPVAIARLSVHIIPILVSTVIIAINLKHLYLGRTLPGVILNNDISTAIFQVLAKIHELLIVSSLSTIIFSVIRVQLLYGTGVPLGLLCSGFNFPEITYFWSEEYWGSMKASIPRRTLFPFAFLLLAAGLVAVTAGPASAILMVPRMQDWSAEVTSFYVRGLADDLHPSRVVGLESTVGASCMNSSAIDLSSCPSSGFSSLMAYAMKQQNIKNGDNLHPPAIGITGQFGNQNIAIDSMTLPIPPSQVIGNIRGLACQTSVLAPWIPVMMYQKPLYSDWLKVIDSLSWTLNHVNVAEYKYKSGQSLTTRTTIPVLRTACSPAQNVSSGEIAIKFPILPEHSCWTDTASVDCHQLRSTTPSSHSKITWLPLPSTFGVTSAGMIFESPWFHDNTSRIVVGCSIDARWADGYVGGQPNQVPSFGLNHQDRSKAWGLLNMGIFAYFRPPKDGSWTPITLDDSWLAVLTPLMEPSSPLTPNMTTLETILHSSALIDDSLINADDPTAFWNEVVPDASNRTLFLEWITALVISDGLSRYGSNRALNSTGPQSEWSLMYYNKRPDFNSRILSGTTTLEPPEGFDYTTFQLEITIQGLSYRAQLVTDYLSIAVLSAHIVLALGHMVYVLRTRQSSVSWGTITELVILAYNSRPVAAALHNMSAGIECIEAYRKVVVVRAATLVRSTGGELDSDHKQAELILLANDGVKTGPVESPRERKSGLVVRATWPLMPSHAESRRLPSSTAALSASWNSKSRSGNSDVRRRLLNGFDEQQRIELDEFYS